MDEQWVGFIFLMVAFIFMGTCFTIDSSHIRLGVIENMIAKCADNGGLKYIEHDYDVKCKNGAEFSYDRFK